MLNSKSENLKKECENLETQFKNETFAHKITKLSLDAKCQQVWNSLLILIIKKIFVFIIQLKTLEKNVKASELEIDTKTKELRRTLSENGYFF